jgi:hypothetical protein
MHTLCRAKGQGYNEVADALYNEKTVDVFPDEARSEIVRNGKSHSFTEYALSDTEYATFVEHFAGAMHELRQTSSLWEARTAWNEERSAVAY